MSLVAWYPLNGDLKDYSGNSRNLTPYGDTASISDNIEGKIGKCKQVALKNKTSRLSADGFSGIFSKDCSMFGWINVIDLLPGMSGLFGNHNHSTCKGMGLTICSVDTSTYKLSCNTAYTDGTRTYDTYKSNMIMSVNKWYNVGFTFSYSENTIRFYINGILDSTHKLSKTMAYGEGSISLFQWSIGYLDNTAYRSGMKLNDIRIYNHALSQKEISEIAKAKILHYNFNAPEEEGTVNLKNSISFNTSIKGSDYFTKSISEAWYIGAGLPSTTVAPGKTYTWSFEVKSNKEFTIQFDPNCTATNYTGNDNAMEASKEYSSGKYTNLNSWQRIHLTVTVKADAASPYLHHSFCPPVSSGDLTVYVRKPQLEEKDHSTIYTPNARSGLICDSSGYGNHIPFTNSTVKWQEDCAIGSGSYYFNGSYINTPLKVKECFSNTSVLDSTFNCWIKVKSLPSTMDATGTILGFASYQGLGLMWYFNSSGNLSFNSYYRSSSAYGQIIKSKPELNTWYMLTSVIDGTILRYYLNGVKIGQTNITLADWNTNISDSSLIGLNTNGIMSGNSTRTYLDCSLDNPEIYKTALSDTDILSLYQSKGSVSKAGQLFINEIIEGSTNNSITKQGQLETLEINEVDGDLFQLYKDGTCRATEFIEI